MAQFTDPELGGAASKQYMVGTVAFDRVSLGSVTLRYKRSINHAVMVYLLSFFLFERTSIQPYNVTQKW